MSVNRPGTTTYSSCYGPRTGTIRKQDPYASPVPVSPRRASNTAAGLPPVVDPERLTYSVSEQYKLKKYRDDHADQINADVNAFHREEEAKAASARRRRDEYKGELETQIRQRSASRESEKQRQHEQKKVIVNEFEAYVQDTLRHKEHQRQRHLEYSRHIQQQHSDTLSMSTRRKLDEDALAQIINDDALLKKQEDDFKKIQKRQLQSQLAQEMIREHEAKRIDKELKRQHQAEEDRAYLQYVDQKAAREEHDRANHIRNHQKSLPGFTLPKIDLKEDKVPDYLSILADEKRQQAVQRAEQQRLTRETLQRQIDEKSARKRVELEQDRVARKAAEQDARRFEEEIQSSRQQQRSAAKENENGVAAQIYESIRRQYRLDS